KDPQGGADTTTRWAYDASGLVQTTTQPDGRFLAMEYDPAGRLTAIRNNPDQRIDYPLDAAGNRLREDSRDADGSVRRSISSAYDAWNQMTAQTDGVGNRTQYRYDGRGRQVAVIDALGNETRSEYDADGN